LHVFLEWAVVSDGPVACHQLVCHPAVEAERWTLAVDGVMCSTAYNCTIRARRVVPLSAEAASYECGWAGAAVNIVG